MDGRYAVFGYLVEGRDVLEELKEGDKIKSTKVVQGAENLVQPQVVATQGSEQEVKPTPTAEIESATVDREAQMMAEPLITEDES
jgi:cyclophilin family peptidyl-prolyl cis-trans isomerase